MSRFYASIKGSRGEATRQGTPKSGIEGYIMGLDLGVEVVGSISAEGHDTFKVYLTSGSSGKGQRELIDGYDKTDLEKR